MDRLCLLIMVPLLSSACGDSDAEDGGGSGEGAGSGVASTTGGSGAVTGSSSSSGAMGAKRMFLGPEQAGDFGGVQGGDAICQAEATAAGLTGTYRALLGSSPAQALALFQGPGPFVAIDAGGNTAVIFANQAGLMDGPLVSLEVDAAGNTIGAGDSWSGVSTRCMDWTSASDALDGTIMSISTSGGDDWLDIGTYPCSSLKHLVCLEQ